MDYDAVDLAFFSTPDRAGMAMIRNFYDRNIPVIDFSGDFRFTSHEDYTVYARNKGMDTDHAAADLLNSCVYGLPELYADSIRKARIIGNPGCFAINMILALLPVCTGGLIASDTIVCDGKTGVSGAGKNPGEANFYPQRHENMNSYREGRHQHLVEVENILNSAGNGSNKILFIPHVVPLNRGILCTIYADIAKQVNTEKIQKIYRDFYHNMPFVMVTDTSPQNADVRGSNFCKMRPFIDERTGKLVIVSVIDNLLKGQSGNAVQNANILFGLDETTGLMQTPFYP